MVQLSWVGLAVTWRAWGSAGPEGHGCYLVLYLTDPQGLGGASTSGSMALKVSSKPLLPLPLTNFSNDGIEGPSQSYTLPELFPGHCSFRLTWVWLAPEDSGSSLLSVCPSLGFSDIQTLFSFLWVCIWALLTRTVPRHQGVCSLELSLALYQRWTGGFCWSSTLVWGTSLSQTISRGPAIVCNSFSGTGYVFPENVCDLWYKVAPVMCFPSSSPSCHSLIRNLVSRGFWSNGRQELLIWPFVSAMSFSSGIKKYYTFS